MRDALTAWRASHFAGFAGASVEVRLPISQAVLNEVLAAEVRPRAPALRRLDVLIQDDNRLDVFVASAQVRWLPSLAVPLRVLPRLGPGPSLRMELVGGGLAARLAPFVAKLSEGHLRGVAINDGSVDVDLSAFIAPVDAQTLGIWLESASIHTEPGVIWVTAKLAMEHAHVDRR